MELTETILQVLSKNYNPELYRNDKRIKSSIIRMIYEFIHYGILHTDSEGKVLNIELAKLDVLSNFNLMMMFESTLISLNYDTVPSQLIDKIESIDYLGKCWYSAKEMADVVSKITMVRHSTKKIYKILEGFTKDGNCIRLTDSSHSKKYRVLYTALTKI